MATLVKVFHEFFPDEPTAADYHDFHVFLHSFVGVVLSRCASSSLTISASAAKARTFGGRLADAGVRLRRLQSFVRPLFRDCCPFRSGKRADRDVISIRIKQ